MPTPQTGRTLHIGEGFEGPGVNLAHINVLVGPRNGPAGQAFATALATPSAGHAPFVVIVQPGVPTKPLTLYVNKAPIAGEFHGNATWGASQAGIAKAVAESLEDGTLPPEADNDWVVVTANWVNPSTDDLDAVFRNNYRAAKNAIKAAMLGLPSKEDVFAAAREVSNPFYTPRLPHGAGRPLKISAPVPCSATVATRHGDSKNGIRPSWPVRPESIAPVSRHHEHGHPAMETVDF
jgi:5,6,7,8-tetrahydromethanopterin hydro-lyase